MLLQTFVADSQGNTGKNLPDLALQKTFRVKHILASFQKNPLQKRFRNKGCFYIQRF